MGSLGEIFLIIDHPGITQDILSQKSGLIVQENGYDQPYWVLTVLKKCE